MSARDRVIGFLVLFGIRHVPLPPEPQPDGRPRAETGLVEPADIVAVESSRVPADRRAELLTSLLLLAAALLAVAFVIAYLLGANTQLLGATLGGALVLAGAALAMAGKAVVPQEVLIEQRPSLEPGPEPAEAAEILRRVGTGVTRRRLLLLSAGAAGTAIGAAALVPAASLGPWIGATSVPSPWRRGTALVDEHGAAILAADLEVGSFLTAFAEGADPEELGSSLVVVRIEPNQVVERRDWAPDGIMAYSKICTHAGCAVAMLRYPLAGSDAPGPALVCPCHYSTFDVTHAGQVVFGPAGRPLPQLPLEISSTGALVAAGTLSGDVGPSWTGVDRGPA